MSNIGAIAAATGIMTEPMTDNNASSSITENLKHEDSNSGGQPEKTSPAPVTIVELSKLDIKRYFKVRNEINQEQVLEYKRAFEITGAGSWAPIVLWEGDKGYRR